MLPTVYMETSVIGYLTAQPSRDVVTAGYQQVTRHWWQTAQNRFDLVASELVLLEAGAGNAEAARARLAILDEVRLLEATTEAAQLTERLLELGAVPRKAAEDAAHIAIAVTNGNDYLVTWNFRHIANAVRRSSIERACRRAGYEPVVICTPNELTETSDEDVTN